MSRYDTYTAPDSPPVLDGDGSFIGVDSYNVPDLLKPGLVQAAINVDFTTQAAVTRGGFVCLPSLGNAPFDAGANWTTRIPAVNRTWRAIAYGGGLFVAVASGGGVGSLIMSSTDAINWTARTPPNTNAWYAITYGNGRFVAVSPDLTVGNVMYSSDAITWTAVSAPSAQWRAVTYGGGLFVAVAIDGITNSVMTSPDGVTWTIRAAAAANVWTGVTYGNGRYVAVGPSKVMYSSDAITWAVASGPSGSLKAVTFGGTTFVATGSNSEVITSTDGATWTSRTSALSPASLDAIAYGNALFIVVASSGTGRVMSSPDGITWTARTAATASTWSAIVNGNNTFVAVASDATATDVMTAGATNNIWASGIYSDPNDAGSQWIMVCGTNSVGFYAYGRQSRSVSYGTGLTVSAQSTIVQCNNLVYIFRGSSAAPLYWTGNWGDTFALAPTPTPSPGFEIIPNSDQATYYQNRLWVINGKDTVSASDVLDFTAYDTLANDFNLNTGSSDFLVTTYPFGTTTLIVFKNKSIIALTAVDGTLHDVVATEITRQVGCIGINAVVSVGADIVYMSDRNINLISLTETNNSLQHKTLPLSSNIKSIIQRVNWNYGYKVSMAYWDNKLFVALPLNNSTSCNSIVVYNFVTEQWFGEWNFSSAIAMQIQGWAVVNYLGATRLHAITEDGRIFAFEGGQNDISGTTVAEISMSMTTRAYSFDNNINITRGVAADLSTNRPSYSITAYSEGASEYATEVSAQTYSRAVSWMWNDSTYNLTNSSDDYNRAFRQDYSTGPASVQCGSGFLPEMTQDFRIPLITRRKSRLAWYNIANTTGIISVNGVGVEARLGDSSHLIQVG